MAATTSASSSGPPTLPGTIDVVRARRTAARARRRARSGPTTRAGAGAQAVARGDGRGDAALRDHDARRDAPRDLARARRRCAAGSRASTSAGSRSRSVATTARPAVRDARAGRAGDPLDLGLGTVAGEGGDARRARPPRDGARSRHSSCAVVAGTNEPHTTSTPRSPLGSGRWLRGAEPVSADHERRSASHDHRAAGVLGGAQATGDRAQVVVALGVGDRPRPGGRSRPQSRSPPRRSAAPVGSRRRASGIAIASPATKRPPLRSSAQRPARRWRVGERAVARVLGAVERHALAVALEQVDAADRDPTGRRQAPGRAAAAPPRAPGASDRRAARRTPPTGARAACCRRAARDAPRGTARGRRAAADAIEPRGLLRRRARASS